MKTLLVLLAAVITARPISCPALEQTNAPPTVAPPASPPMSAGAAMFHDPLAPYGSWFWLARYGWVWTPHDVDYGWRPYTDGSWTYTDCGWTWVSDREWGWAPFHYGRWAYEAPYGWVWVPDTVWGPAWVAWNFADPWCGWAPLPPLVSWDAGLAWDIVIPPFCWSFVEVGFLAVPHVHHHLVPAARNVTLLHETRNITRFVVQDKQVINVGVDPVRVERATGHNLPHLRVENVTTTAQRPGITVQQDKVMVFRPDLAQPSRAVALSPTGRPEPGPTLAQPRTETAPSAPALSRDFLQRQEAERRQLAEAQAREAAQLEEIHQRELEHPPGGLGLPGLAQRHFEEHRALNEQISRQNQLFEHRVQQGIGQWGPQRLANPPSAKARRP